MEQQQDKNEQRLQMVLEGIVTIIAEIENQKKTVTNIDNRLSNLEQRVYSLQQHCADTLIMSNNIVNDVEDIRESVSTVIDKIDALDYTVRNLRIYKYYGGE